jgi:hypothetical protein
MNLVFDPSLSFEVYNNKIIVFELISAVKYATTNIKPNQTDKL